MNDDEDEVPDLAARYAELVPMPDTKILSALSAQVVGMQKESLAKVFESMQPVLAASSAVNSMLEQQRQMMNNIAPLLKASESIRAITSYVPAIEALAPMNALLERQRAWMDIAVPSIPAFALPDVRSIFGESTFALMESITAQHSHFYDNVFPAIQAAASQFDAWWPSWAERLQDLVAGIDARRFWLPTNWPKEIEPWLPRLHAIAADEGIPLTFVPSWSIVKELCAADGPEARWAILVEHRDEILEQCAEQVEGIYTDDSEVLRRAVEMAREVISTARKGEWTTAAVTAVVIVNALVEKIEWPTQERSARKRFAVKGEIALRDATQRVTGAATILLYAEWSPKSGKPAPATVARHVVGHNVLDANFEDANPLIAVMHMASILATVEHEGLLERSAEAA